MRHLANWRILVRQKPGGERHGTGRPVLCLGRHASRSVKEPATIDTRKALALFVYLAVTRRPHTRDAIAGLLWPEYDQAHARATLRRTLSPLHRLLGEGYLSIEREMLALQPDATLWSDVDEFEALLARCQTHGHDESVACAECLPLLNQAADLYADSFLAGSRCVIAQRSMTGNGRRASDCGAIWRAR